MSNDPHPFLPHYDVVEENIKNGIWYKTVKGYYRLTEKGWNTLSPKVRLGTNYQDYQDKIAE